MDDCGCCDCCACECSCKVCGGEGFVYVDEDETNECVACDGTGKEL